MGLSYIFLKYDCDNTHFFFIDFRQMMIALSSYNHTHIDQLVMHGRGVHSHVVEASLGTSSVQFTVDKDLKSIFFTDRGRNKKFFWFVFL